jgi:hypothetical protein
MVGGRSTRVRVGTGGMVVFL